MNFSLDKTIASLELTPKVLRTQLGELAPEWTQRPYGENTWSVHEIVGHLIWGEKTDWIVRVQHILEHGDSIPFAAFDRNGHVELCERHKTSELLDLFEEERRQSVAKLTALSLTDKDLCKEGVHPALGRATLSQLLATWTVHDFNHIAQINKAIAFQYRSAVGPWEQYLSILSPPNPR